MAAIQSRFSKTTYWLWPHGVFALLVLSILLPPMHGAAADQGICPHCKPQAIAQPQANTSKSTISLAAAQPEKLKPRLFILGVLVEATIAVFLMLKISPITRTAARDIGGTALLLLAFWQCITARWAAINLALMPEPEKILAVLLGDLPDLLVGAGRSLTLFAFGYGLALLFAIPLGILVGWHTRVFLAARFVVKILGPLPPIVYVPYAIAVMPTFRAAAVTVVCIGAFWPIFIRTMNGVRLIPAAQLDAARMLNLGTFTMLRRVVLPGTLPAICGGATLGLVFAFVLLTAAELIGASGGISSGLGYYVLYADEIQDHRRVLAGIIFIGGLVSGIVLVMDRIEKRLLRWKD